MRLPPGRCRPVRRSAPRPPPAGRCSSRSPGTCARPSERLRSQPWVRSSDSFASTCSDACVNESLSWACYERGYVGECRKPPEIGDVLPLKRDRQLSINSMREPYWLTFRRFRPPRCPKIVRARLLNGDSFDIFGKSPFSAPTLANRLIRLRRGAQDAHKPDRRDSRVPRTRRFAVFERPLYQACNRLLLHVCAASRTREPCQRIWPIPRRQAPHFQGPPGIAAPDRRLI